MSELMKIQRRVLLVEPCSEVYSILGNRMGWAQSVSIDSEVVNNQLRSVFASNDSDLRVLDSDSRSVVVRLRARLRHIPYNSEVHSCSNRINKHNPSAIPHRIPIHSACRRYMHIHPTSTEQSRSSSHSRWYNNHTSCLRDNLAQLSKMRED